MPITLEFGILNSLTTMGTCRFGATQVYHLFRAQEPKAPVTYCDHALSVVRRPSSVRLFTFSTSSPELLDGF